MVNGRILVVDDETNSRNALSALLREEDYEVEVAQDGYKALGKFDEGPFDIVLTDVQMPGMTGVELLAKIRAKTDDVAVVLMTAFGDVSTAVAAMRAGAADYLTKPIEVAQLMAVMGRELERVRLRREAGALRARLSEKYSFTNLIGDSPPMQDVFKTIAQVASSKASVLITGESGTGKELVAAALHERSARARRPFVKLHCAALAESLLESELFGHERGAFTGAVGRREGRFAQANGGTLFLDEVGEISPAVQVKLLRFLQEHTFERVGSNETVTVDVRIVAATNRDLQSQLRTGRFREDLFYRLNVINIVMPALRDRLSDAPVLAAHFLRKYGLENGKDQQIKGFDSAALAALCSYSWPGNVRELENVIERAVVMCNGERITTAELPDGLHVAATHPLGIRIPGSTLQDVERYLITQTLEAAGGSTALAAEMLGISIRKIQYKMHQYHPAPRAGVAVVSNESFADVID